MRKREELTGIDPSVGNVGAASTLFLNARETAASAVHENAALILRAREMGRAVTQRLVIGDNPDRSKSLTEIPVACRTKRVKLIPPPGRHYGVDSIYMRVPEVPGRPLLFGNAFFFEVTYVGESQPSALRDNFLLIHDNDSDDEIKNALYRYGSAADIDSSSDGTQFMVKTGISYPEPPHTVKLMSRLISEAAFGQQSIYDITA